jgi:hypothetical protein
MGGGRVVRRGWWRWSLVCLCHEGGLKTHHTRTLTTPPQAEFTGRG